MERGGGEVVPVVSSIIPLLFNATATVMVTSRGVLFSEVKIQPALCLCEPGQSNN